MVVAKGAFIIPHSYSRWLPLRIHRTPHPLSRIDDILVGLSYHVLFLALLRLAALD